MFTKIKQLLQQKDAVIIAHYYVDAQIQRLAEETGGIVADSLEMAKFGAKHPAKTLIVAGVRFMGETAKILTPNKRILMPDLGATCSLDEGCDPKDFAKFCQQYQEHTVVVYVNTSAAIKAMADWTVTSSCAVPIIKHLVQQGKKILWAPDKYLGNYIQKQLGADMIMWQGSCIVHEEFDVDTINELQKKHPDAAVLAHPESYPATLEIADVVGSTSQLLKASQELPNKEFIIATESGIIYKMQQASPHKKFIPVFSKALDYETCRACSECPWMKMNNLENLAAVLENEDNEIFIDEDIRKRALVPLERMINFTPPPAHPQR